MLGSDEGRAIALALAVALSGCGDPPMCQNSVFIAIQTSQIVNDVDAATTGVQAEIHVRTSLPAGEHVKLEVLDGAGRVSSTSEVAVDASGNATFKAVTVPTPSTTLRASARSICGEGSDEIAIDVLAGPGCDLVLLPAPVTNSYYAPLRVLNSVNDPDPGRPGFQLGTVVMTRPGWGAELFENAGNGEHLVDALQADASGITRFMYTPPEGRVTFRATCRSGELSSASEATTIVIDTTPPACVFTAPPPGATITPAFDMNGDLGDGVQLVLAASIAGPDVEGEPTQITVRPPGGSPTAVTSTPVDSGGASTAPAELVPASTPATYELAVVARDHAGNTCLSAQSYDVVYDGCSIGITAPIAPVTSDANGSSGDGSQVDVIVQVDEACVGQTVTSTCGTNSPAGVVPVGGQVILRADVCATSPCEAQAECLVSVTRSNGVTTSTSTMLVFDDQGPPVSLALVAPTLGCGTQISPAADADPGTDGVQIIARVTSPGATQRMLDLTNGAGGVSFDATNDVSVTLAPGANQLVGKGSDALGNTSHTSTCGLTLADLAVSFAPPAADGVVTRSDGTVTGSSLAFPLCGSVNRTGATVEVAIDGGPPAPATVTGATWCRNVTLQRSPPSHTIVATATAGSSFGTSALVLAVDFTVNVTTDAATYRPGESMVVSWQHMSTNPRDWIGIAPLGGKPTAVIKWVYTNGVTDGSRTFSPIAPGTYVIRAFSDDSYNIIGESTPFNVTP